MKPPQVIDAFVQLQIPLQASMWLGVLQIIFAVLYLLPAHGVSCRTVLFTGYLGGAVAIHLRAQLSVFSFVFPVLVGVLLWVGAGSSRYHRGALAVDGQARLSCFRNEIRACDGGVSV